MHRVLILLIGVAFLVACESPEPSLVSLGASQEETFEAIIQMAEDKDWTVEYVSDTTITILAPEEGSEYELIYTALFEPGNPRMSLSVHRDVGKFGQRVVWLQDLYDEFIADLRTYL